jgi:uncharacterized protein YrrD
MINASRLLGTAVDAEDGHIGSVHDLYFDERTWELRYLVIDMGKWLPGKKVLIVPDAIRGPWHNQKSIPVGQTKEQVRSSPEIDTAKPLSRLAEESLHDHYGWIPYWNMTGVPVPPPAPPIANSEEDRREAQEKAERSNTMALRSARETAGYRVEAADGEVGRVDDFVLDEDIRRVLFLVVNVKGWLFHKRVLAPVSLVSKVDWASGAIYVDAHSEALKNAHEYHPAA